MRVIKRSSTIAPMASAARLMLLIVRFFQLTSEGLYLDGDIIVKKVKPAETVTYFYKILRITWRVWYIFL